MTNQKHMTSKKYMKLSPSKKYVRTSILAVFDIITGAQRRQNGLL